MSIEKKMNNAACAVALRTASAACLAFSSAAFIWAVSRQRAYRHPAATGRCERRPILPDRSGRRDPGPRWQRSRQNVPRLSSRFLRAGIGSRPNSHSLRTMTGCGGLFWLLLSPMSSLSAFWGTSIVERRARLSVTDDAAASRSPFPL
jgi:hypothetical protein